MLTGSTLVEQRLNSILTFLDQGIRATTDFAVDQAPDVAQQIIAWAIYSNLIASILCTLGAFACFYLMRKAIIKLTRAKLSFDAEGGFQILAGVSGFAGGLCLTFSICSLFGFLKPLIAPKLFLIEYVAALLK